jgi:DNA end-binding protein Ku
MPRAIWSGALTFGLVSVPVKLFSAVTHREVRFHLLHDKDGARIREKRVCSAEGKEVPYEHIVKGYEIGRGRYVTATREELAALDPKATRSVDIEDFVALAQIDPVYYDAAYYLVPDRGGSKAYGLLHAAMKKLDKVAIARIVMRTRQHLCAVRPLGSALMLSTMLWADEVVPASSVEELPSSPARPQARELAMAQQLIESLVGDFRPEKYKDDYRARVLEVLARKAEGEGVVAPAEAPPAGEVIDLMTALKRSLAQKGGGRAASAIATRRRRQAEKARGARRGRPRARAGRKTA